jgi:hypothetical protein
VVNEAEGETPLTAAGYWCSPSHASVPSTARQMMAPGQNRRSETFRQSVIYSPCGATLVMSIAGGGLPRRSRIWASPKASTKRSTPTAVPTCAGLPPLADAVVHLAAEAEDHGPGCVLPVDLDADPVLPAVVLRIVVRPAVRAGAASGVPRTPGRKRSPDFDTWDRICKLHGWAQTLPDS